jgi:hypothetical protein
MFQIKTDRSDVPVDESLDPEVISFRGQFDGRSPMDEIVKEGARRMLQAAIDAEVEAFIAMHADRIDERCRRLVVKNEWGKGVRYPFGHLGSLCIPYLAFSVPDIFSELLRPPSLAERFHFSAAVLLTPKSRQTSTTRAPFRNCRTASFRRCSNSAAVPTGRIATSIS